MTEITPIRPMIPLQQIAPLGEAQSVQSTSALSNAPFANILGQAMQGLGEAQAAAEADSLALATGKIDDLAGMMIRSAQSATALETTVQLAGRAVSAYKEILQMQV